MPGESLPRWRPREPVAARKLDIPNRVLERQQQPLASVGQRAPDAASLTIALFRYKSMEDDHVVCRTWDGTNEGETDVKVAKPYLLRSSVTSRDGITYTYTDAENRTADNGSATETQVIVPSYVADDLIFAARVARGVDVSVEDVPLLWLDLNVDGRAWAKADS